MAAEQSDIPDRASVEVESKASVLFTIHCHAIANSGAAGAILSLANTMRMFGCKVEILSFNDLPRIIPSRFRQIAFPWFVAARVLRMGVRWDIVDGWSDDCSVLLFVRKWRISRFSRRTKIVVHSHGLEHVWLDAVEKEHSRTRMLTWKVPFDWLQSLIYERWMRLRFVEYAMKHGDACLFLNKVDREFAERRLDVDQSRGYVVRNGVPELFIGRSITDADQSSIKVWRIAQIGRYVMQKGIRYGTPALNTVLRRFPTTEVHFLGTNCDPAEVFEGFEPGLHDRVKVTPFYDRSELPELIRDHRVLFFPTLAEGAPLAMIEAMCCGLVPVTTATPGPLELVEPDREGLVVPPRDVDALVAAVARLITDPELWKRLRVNAYQRAQRSAWRIVTQERLAIYATVGGRSTVAQAEVAVSPGQPA